VRFNAFEAPGAVDVAGEREHRGKEGVESAELRAGTNLSAIFKSPQTGEANIGN
jgi:hypothetical protein